MAWKVHRLSGELKQVIRRANERNILKTCCKFRKKRPALCGHLQRLAAGSENDRSRRLGSSMPPSRRQKIIGRTVHVATEEPGKLKIVSLLILVKECGGWPIRCKLGALVLPCKPSPIERGDSGERHRVRRQAGAFFAAVVDRSHGT